jgi:hypothetical protein
MKLDFKSNQTDACEYPNCKAKKTIYYGRESYCKKHYELMFFIRGFGVKR